METGKVRECWCCGKSFYTVNDSPLFVCKACHDEAVLGEAEVKTLDELQEEWEKGEEAKAILRKGPADDEN